MKASFFRLCLLLFLLGVAKSYSQTLNWASLTGSEIVDSHGNPLDNTYQFQLGAFSSGFVPDETNIANWASHWNAFDTLSHTTQEGPGYFYDPVNLGYFTGTQDVQDVPFYTSRFEGLTAYIWIYNNIGTEYFLATASDNSWVFPNLDPGCCPNGEVTTWSVSDIGNDNPVWGGQLGNEGAGEHSVSGPYDIQTYVVPEIGSSVLALLGVGLAVMRRRRNDR